MERQSYEDCSKQERALKQIVKNCKNIRNISLCLIYNINKYDEMYKIRNQN